MMELSLENLQEFDKIWNIENDYIIYMFRDDVWKILNDVLVEYIYAKTSNCFKLSLVNDNNYIYVYINSLDDYSTNIIVSNK